MGLMPPAARNVTAYQGTGPNLARVPNTPEHILSEEGE